MPQPENEFVQLQQRDIALMRGLFESRVMTVGHIAALYFEGKREAAKKRLQKLKASGLIAERRRRVNEPSVLFLTRRAFLVLQNHGALSEYPTLSPAAFERRAQVSHLTLRHELEVMDVKAAIHSEVAKSGQFILAEFITWPLLCQFEARRAGRDGAAVLVKPDGFLRIHERERDGGLSEHTFFLEVDRSSESQNTLIARAGCYVDYYASGGFALRNGGARDDFKDYPFRVLMVFKTEERRNNTAERLLQIVPPILTQVWLSTLREATANPLGGIWIRPADYRQATKGTPFDPEERDNAATYRRRTEREKLVEAQIKKLRMLD